ncbi:hypothetical protein BH11MYX2_BH11MYX2_31540 [soil metagenome]
MRTALFLAVLSAATVAHANVWDHASSGDAGSLDSYRDAMSQGDGYTRQANAVSLTADVVKQYVDRALASYQLAASKRPSEGEPYYRMAEVLGAFFTDCPVMARRFQSRLPQTCPGSGSAINRDRAVQASDAWDKFEQLAPLDPRVNDARFERAILRTKLVEGAKDPAPLLERALTYYIALIDRSDGTSNFEPEVVWGNLAETYMMLGKLGDAIDSYKVAVSMGAGPSTAYGLAVAFDRDGSPGEALDTIRAQGEDAVNQYYLGYLEGAIFYVPRGEVNYYMGLVMEAWGHYDLAADNWDKFVKSGAHPLFQARAKQHLDAMTKKAKLHPEVRSGNAEDLYELP